MIKVANLQAVWPFIHQKLQGIYPGQLPRVDQVKFDSNSHPEEPNALGYVSTEDADDDGKLDTIHIQYQKLEQALNQAGITSQDLANINQLEEEKLNAVLEAVVEVLAHEQGHISDYQHGTDNPFPGGESVADSAARSALNQFRSRIAQKINILKTAQELDNKGFYNYADQLEKIAQQDDFENNKNVIDLSIYRDTKKEEAPKEIVVVLDDFDTWSGDGYIVTLTPQEYDRLRDGEKLGNIISIQDAENTDKVMAISDLLG